MKQRERLTRAERAAIIRVHDVAIEFQEAIEEVRGMGFVVSVEVEIPPSGGCSVTPSVSTEYDPTELMDP